MEVIAISDRVEITATETDPWNWPQQQQDELQGLPKFICYIGGNNYSKLDAIVANIPYPVKSIRRDAKHFRHRWKHELKIWGLSWDDTQKIALQISPEIFQVELSLIDLAS
ncbi:MAG: hypothetical protein F6K36_22930 [Symploca sp. SIO3C6]|nr:hypothetical protein [Symploca sp. SIO3C6]